MEINETIELLDGAMELVTQYKSAMEDGSIGIMDLPKLIPIFKKVKMALEGLNAIPAELKDLDDSEVIVLFDRITSLVTEIMVLIEPKE